jgi:predicted aldo/keto reductase-like oxidoreductase
MPKRVLGRTKLAVSLLGFGVGPVIDPAVYRRAVELGVTYFHLGFDKYSIKLEPPEKYNRQALAALKPLRKRITVSYMTTVRSTKDELLADLDDFLAASGFGDIDVWFVCCPSPDLLEEFGEAMEVARTAGKARWAAMATHGLERDVPIMVAPDSAIDVVMMGYNFASSPKIKESLAKLHAAGLGITPMKPLAGRFYKDATDSPAPLLRWLAADDRVHTIPVGMTTIEHVEQNAVALQQPISDKDRKALEGLLAHTSPRLCRLCGNCDGRCPRGLAVSDLVRTAMYAEGYGNLRMAQSHFAAIPASRRRVACADCPTCLVQCPNGVAVRDRILRAQALLS